MKTLKPFFGVLLALLGLGCGVRPDVQVATGPENSLRVVPLDQWPALVDDLPVESLLESCELALGYYEAAPADRVYRFGPEVRTAAQLRAGVQRFHEIVAGADDMSAARDALQASFSLLRSVGRDGHGEVFFTGYFEPLMEARKQPEGEFRHPIYTVPDDLLTIEVKDFGVEASQSRLMGRVDGRRVVPYYDRDAIDHDGVLHATVEVLAYLDDPLKLFFLHVQGSGTVIFPSGERQRAGYAATNGRPYRSIGKLLLDEGAMTVEEMSMQGIVAYLEAHPTEVRRVLGSNPSYVFFRALDASGGPLGCYQVPLTAERAIATDRRFFPAPVVAWVNGQIPVSSQDDGPIKRFVLNLDTGGSIRGPGRVDLFFGAGDEAGALAGRTKHTGELFFLLPIR